MATISMRSQNNDNSVRPIDRMAPGASMMPSQSSPALSGPLKARMMNQAKARRISLTQSGMSSSRNSVGTIEGLAIFER